MSPTNMSPTLSLLVVTLALVGATEIIPSMPGMFSARGLGYHRAVADDADVCQGKQTTCADSTTLQVCADLGNGYMPVGKMACPTTGTPYCVEGRCVAEPPTTVPPRTTPRTTTPSIATPPPPPMDDTVCGGRLSVCADCYTRTLCARLGSHVVPVSNATCGADAPYCVEGVCKPDLPVDSTCPPLPAPESSFRCYGEGYFPDPADCTKYHLCVSGKAYDYDCSAVRAGLVYDQGRALCVPAGKATCFSFNCIGQSGRYINYAPDQTLYALCVTDDSHDALVAACPPGHRLHAEDPLNVRCAPFCARVGRYADAEDVTGAGYYECLASSSAAGGGDLVGPLRGSCPKGAAFDADSERCQPLAPAPKETTVIVTSTTSLPSTTAEDRTTTVAPSTPAHA